MILDDEEYDDETNVKLQEYIMGEAMQPPPPDKIYQIVQSITGANKGTGTINWGAPAGWVAKDFMGFIPPNPLLYPQRSPLTRGPVLSFGNPLSPCKGAS